MGQNNLFQFSVDNALEIAIIFDDGGRIIYANHAAKQQLEFEDGLVGNRITDIFPGAFSVEGNSLKIQGGKPGEIMSLMAYRSNQTCFPTRVKILKNAEYSEALRLSGSPRETYVCLAYDITNEDFLEKKVSHADQEAEAAQRVKSEFVANVTHELRTPVNGISGNIRELLSQETDAEKLKLLQMVERSCRDMNALINNILDFSKLEAGKFVLEPREFQFRNMIEYVKGNHSNRIIEKGLDFTISVSPQIPEHIIGDELRIVQILNNLISNAYKFTSVGEIHLEVVQTARAANRMQLFFMVMDSGIGIAKGDQDKLFKSFSQVDASISRKYGGTGLGLNITKQLVELMGGRIHVQSEAGKGTTFSFDIWVGVPEKCMGCSKGEDAESTAAVDEQELVYKLQGLTETRVSEKIWIYGEPENLEELEKKMSKLILSVEMENWEKAEMFAETVKQLTEEAPREVKNAAFRLKMAVQKGNYEKTLAAYEVLREMF